jgi:hypothetical protein
MNKKINLEKVLKRNAALMLSGIIFAGPYTSNAGQHTSNISTTYVLRKEDVEFNESIVSIEDSDTKKALSNLYQAKRTVEDREYIIQKSENSLSNVLNSTTVPKDKYTMMSGIPSQLRSSLDQVATVSTYSNSNKDALNIQGCLNELYGAIEKNIMIFPAILLILKNIWLRFHV